MLASITPLGERGRGSNWGVTVSAFLIGSTAAGAAAGALAGAAGSIALGDAISWRTRLAVLTVALVTAIALEILPGRLPGPRRQVNERWLDQFRGWVYGLGFGAQLGLAVTTIVSSAAIYVALLAGFLAGDVLRGALVLGCFGAARGLMPLVAVRVRRPDQLRQLHARLERWRAPAGRATVAVLCGMLALAVVGVLA
jgi:MFS family permease